MILDGDKTNLKGKVLLINDEQYILLYREVTQFGHAPWLIGAYLKVSEVEGREAWRLLILSAFYGLGIMALALVILVLIARRIRRPVLDLAMASDKVRELKFSEVPTMRPSWVRELNQAENAFRAMVDGLRLFETYVPRSLVLRLLRADGAVGVVSEERFLTLMFTDIAGFTSAAEKMSAAETAEHLNQHFTELNRHVENEDGTVDKYIGDCMMAFWGAPEEQKDHAARGCRAILAIEAAVRASNARLAEKGEPPFRMRIGLHSGPAIAGNIGAPGRVNYTVVGDTVNVANRLEQLGKEVLPDDDVALLVSEETARLAGQGFSFEEMGAFTIRGRESKLTVFRLNQSSGAEQATEKESQPAETPV